MKVFIDTNVILEYFMHREMFDVAEHDKNSLLRGISNKEYKDIEDSCQYQVAQKVDCEALVSFNISDYKESADVHVRIYTPQQFIDYIYTQD